MGSTSKLFHTNSRVRTNSGMPKKLSNVCHMLMVHAAFDKYVCPKKNLTMMRFKFFMTYQKESQSMEEFIKEIQLKSRDCEFNEDENINDSLIRDRIICGMKDKKMQEKLLMAADDTKVTLEKVITACRAYEEATYNTQVLTSASALNTASLNQISDRQQWRQKEQYNNGGRKCNRCGQNHQQGKCTAFGKRCGFCNRPNHFEAMCFTKQNMSKTRSTPTSYNENSYHKQPGYSRTQIQGNKYNVKEVSKTQFNEEDNREESEDFFVNTVKSTSEINAKTWDVNLVVNNDKSITFKIDSGSDVDIISKEDYDKLNKAPDIEPATISLVAYNQTPITTYGKCDEHFPNVSHMFVNSNPFFIFD